MRFCGCQWQILAGGLVASGVCAAKREAMIPMRAHLSPSSNTPHVCRRFIAGQSIAHLFAATSGTDSDWVVKVQIQSSWFPLYDSNPQSFVEWLKYQLHRACGAFTK